MSDQIDRAADEFHDARRAAREARREFAKTPIAKFVRTTMPKAMKGYLEARHQGVPREEAIDQIEATLRTWPTTSAFTPDCERCEDTGYRQAACRNGQRCGRPRCATAGIEHSFTTICGCKAGDARRRKGQKGGDDPAAAAGRTQRQKGLFGGKR